MNKVETLNPLNVSSTTAILFGKLTAKDATIFGVAFCLKEGDVGDPTFKDQVVGLITGDFPVAKFASTAMGLKPDTHYRCRSVGADPAGKTYLITPPLPGVEIIDDVNGLIFGDTPAHVSFNATTKHALVNGVWDVDCSVSGVFTLHVPPEMGGDGSGTITYRFDTTKLPKTDLDLDIVTTKIPVAIFYGKTIGFKTDK